MGGPVELAGDKLRAIVERIEHVEDEIRELNEAKKEIYLEAKSNGFDVKVLREVVRLRKQDQKEREELDELLDVYLRAIKERLVFLIRLLNLDGFRRVFPTNSPRLVRGLFIRRSPVAPPNNCMFIDPNS
jgi:uncharacterized protein (UPF0335 family)